MCNKKGAQDSTMRDCVRNVARAIMCPVRIDFKFDGREWNWKALKEYFLISKEP